MRNSLWCALTCAAVAVLAAVAIGRRLSDVNRPPLARPKASELLLPGEPELVARIEAKHRIAAELIAGRTSLLQAAAAFRDFDGHEVHTGSWRCLPAGRLGRRSILPVRHRLRRRPSPAGEDDDLVCTLEAELYERGHAGTAHFLGPRGPSSP